MRAFVLVSMFVLIFAAGCMAKQEKSEKSSQFDNSVHSSERSQIEEALVKKLNTKCTQKDVSSCVMLKLVSYMNRMLKKASIQVGDDIEIAENSAAVEAIVETPKSFTGVPDESTEDDQIADLLLTKAWTFVKTRSLKFKLMDDADLVIANTPDSDGSMNVGISIKPRSEEGRGKTKNLAPFLAAAAMKVGLMGGLAFKGLVLLVGKALLVSKIALLLASIIGLKKLFSHQKHVTYEVVAHPHHHDGPGHDAVSDWGRELGRADQSHDLAYNAQKPKSDYVSQYSYNGAEDQFKPLSDKNKYGV